MSRVRFIDHSPGWLSNGAPPGRYILATDLQAVVAELDDDLEEMKNDPKRDTRVVAGMQALNDIYKGFMRQVLAL